MKRTLIKYKTVTATVAYPVQVTVDVPEDRVITDEELRNMILDKAEKLFDSSSIKPGIIECSEANLID